MADARGYDRPEGKLIEATAAVLVESLPPDKARELAILIQRRSMDFAANHQPANSCRKLREEVFRLLEVKDVSRVCIGCVGNHTENCPLYQGEKGPENGPQNSPQNS